MIDLSINKVGLEHNIQKAKENHIIIPTIAQMQNPESDPGEDPGQAFHHAGLWDVDPVNLFRITWHNEAKESGGLLPGGPQLCGDPHQALRRSLPYRCHGRQVVPHRLPQGGRFLRLSGSPSGDRPV